MMRPTLIVYAHPETFRILSEGCGRFDGTRRSFRDRLYAAWLVFTGRADALMWPEDNALTVPSTPRATPSSGHGCKRAGGFVDSGCNALCDCHITLALPASSVPSTPRECGLCGGPLPCLTHSQGLAASSTD